MRIRTLLLLGSMAFAAATVPAQAFTLPATDATPGRGSDILDVAVHHCHPGFHWVRPHHAKDGRMIHGQCVRDHHH